MKKKIITILFMVALCFGLVGCEYEINSTTETNSITESNPSISYWVDEETGVQYLIYYGYSQGGITPRLNADGSLYIEDKGGAE